MKRSLFFLIIICFSFSMLYSQVDYGLKMGLHLGQVEEVLDDKVPFDDFVESYNGETVLKPQLGLWFSIPLSERLYLQPEILWTQKQWKPDGIPDSIRNPIDFDYFSVPLSLGYMAGNWQITLGPELTFLLDQRFSKKRNYTPNDSSFIEEYKFGLAINLGVQYHLQRWIIGVRANRDLTEFVSFDFTDANGEPYGRDRFYHQGMTLWAGYALSAGD